MLTISSVKGKKEAELQEDSRDIPLFVVICNY